MQYHRHRPLSVASVDLDIESGSRIDSNYDTGLPWPLGVQSLAWSAKGPLDQAPSLSFAQSAKAHLHSAKVGWSDANRWPSAFSLIAESSEIRIGIIKGLLLSSSIAAIIFSFELAFFPTALFQSESAHNVFWLYPLIGGSYLLALSWTSSIASAAYRLRNGQPKPPPPSLTHETYRLFLILNYTLLFLALGQIPYVGQTLSFLFMSLVDGYYCFEQAWIARGWSLERRLKYCEERYAYFIAFGSPSTAASFFHQSGLLNLFLFMLVFPFCTVLALLANPPDEARRMCWLLPSRLPVFWPTVMVHRAVVRATPQTKRYGRSWKGSPFYGMGRRAAKTTHTL